MTKYGKSGFKTLGFLKNIANNPISNIIDIIKGDIGRELSYKGKTRRNAFLQILIVTLAFIMLIRVYPVRAYEKHTNSRQKAFEMSELANLDGDLFGCNDKKLQTVYFSSGHLYSIKMYVECALGSEAESAQSILFRLYNDEFSCIYEEEYPCESIAGDGYIEVLPNMDVALDTAYYYELIVPEENTAQIFVPVAPRDALGQTENSTLYIDGIINDEVCLIADFDYSRQLSAVEVLGIWFLIIAAAVVLYVLIMYAAIFCDKRLGVSVKKCLKYAVSAIIVILAVILFVPMVVLNKFGGDWMDRLFFTIALVIGVFWLMGALWGTYFSPKGKFLKTSIPHIWRSYIQTVSFALLFYALCQYVNADRELYHMTNTRWMLIFMAIALLMMYNEKQLLNKLSYVWLGLSAICSFAYCGSIDADEKELLVAKLTCGVVMAWGLLLINILLRFRIGKFWKGIKQLKAWQLIYGALWIAFATFMFVYRFEKTWVFTAVLPFMALLFINMTERARRWLLNNFANGILLSFAFVTAFSLIHRPHHYWRLYRYGGIFHTVACTGMYLAVVLCAALSKLYARFKDNTGMSIRYKLIQCRGELFMLSVVIDFIVLTISRTAFLTAAVTVILTVLLDAAVYHKKLMTVLRETGTFVILSIGCFPLVFTAVRTIPAVVNDPVRYDIELQDNDVMICKDDPIDSAKYITVRHFFEMLFLRFSDTTGDTAGIKVVGASELLAYTGEYFKNLGIIYVDNDDSDEAEEKYDVSNGRFEIFKAYFEELSLRGHPKMGPTDESGNPYGHAHNSYLQIAYNFGIIAGIIFLAICAFSLLRAVGVMYEYGRVSAVYLMPFALITTFGFMSLTEWASHPCIPAGFCFFMMQPLLIRR